MNTTENNKLIAEFMGAKEVRKDNFKFPNRTGLPLQIGTINYHSDWNWLMEVVEKIESLEIGRFKVEIYNTNCRIYDHEEFDEISDLSAGTKIEATYNACIEFIKWYNQQNK